MILLRNPIVIKIIATIYWIGPCLETKLSCRFVRIGSDLWIFFFFGGGGGDGGCDGGGDGGCAGGGDGCAGADDDGTPLHVPVLW